MENNTIMYEVSKIMLDLVKKEEEELKQIPNCIECGKLTPIDKNKLITDKWTLIRQHVDAYNDINFNVNSNSKIYFYPDKLSLMCADCSGLNENVWWERI